MFTYHVTHVRKEKSEDGTHEHIEGVCIGSGTHYTRREVVESLRSGDTWRTKVDGAEATIRSITSCPRASCPATPYITTRPDDSLDNNLENLPTC